MVLYSIDEETFRVYPVFKSVTNKDIFSYYTSRREYFFAQISVISCKSSIPDTSWHAIARFCPELTWDYGHILP
jgi:hypothetical protein